MNLGGGGRDLFQSCITAFAV